jgi:hypothetical protein
MSVGSTSYMTFCNCSMVKYSDPTSTNSMLAQVLHAARPYLQTFEMVPWRNVPGLDVLRRSVPGYNVPAT